MARKLHYFNVNGLGEPIRYLLHYGKQNFEDVRYERATWPIKSVKDSLPYGQLPLYEEGGRSLNQSLAIARYLGQQFNLVPTDIWEQAELDAAVYNVYDFWAKALAWFKEKDVARKEILKKEILNEHIDFFFSRFERDLKANKGYFGGKLSWADFVFVGIVEVSNLFFGMEIEKKYPTVQALMQKVRTLPGVKEYIATRKPYTM
ncbi:glutathione S-transferase-like [Aricia agestis]|uniref:glutathione S-transferase-like n=1 Tax=Aricia agestis TaxID=91739 RepID=UPI001C204044|nr:glutathione S-transferase-like [Aricia agestis]